MQFFNDLITMISSVPEVDRLWDGKYKIPWDEPEFSRRMLREHFSQDHDLASRRQELIDVQVKWIHERLRESHPAKLLDIFCGPGLYIKEFLKLGYDCTGIDISPASIVYAQENIGGEANFILGGILDADFEQKFDLAAMIYGEFNVFPLEDVKRILQKAYDALLPGGKLMLEIQSCEAVKRAGETAPGWYKAESGLFSDSPHLCLMENHWFDREQTSLQIFHVMDVDKQKLQVHKSTTRAWGEEELLSLFTGSGFIKIMKHDDWPVQSNDLVLWSMEASNGI